MKRALVLAGGGSRGAFQAGAIDYLVNKTGLDFNVFYGTSVGALNASILGQARNFRELTEQVNALNNLWLGIEGNSSIYQSGFLDVFNLLFRDSLYYPKGLRKLLKEYVDPNRLCHNPAKYIKVATVAIETGELFFADSRNPNLTAEILDYILASASIPPFFPPVHIQQKHWYDGGLRDVTPLGAAFKEHPDEIVIILPFLIDEQFHPVIPHVSYGNLIQSLLRAVGIMSNEISANDLQLARIINQYHRLFPGKRQIPIYIIAPKTPLEGEILDFSPEAIRANIKKGYESAHSPISISQITSKKFA